jgi:hypothetical protein
LLKTPLIPLIRGKIDEKKEKIKGEGKKRYKM